MTEYASTLKSKEMDDLFHTILQLQDLSECYQFFEDICTVPELLSVAQRWQVASMLDKGITYQEISGLLNASTATISRVNRCVTRGTGGYQLMLDRAKKAES